MNPELADTDSSVSDGEAPLGDPAEYADTATVIVLFARNDVTFAAALRDRLSARAGHLRIELALCPCPPPDESSNVHDRRHDLDELNDRLKRAWLVIPLLSADSFADGAIRLIEQALALKARVVPVLVRACDWEDTPAGGLDPLPFNRIPISSHANPEEAYAWIVDELRDLLDLRNIVRSHRDEPNALERDGTAVNYYSADQIFAEGRSPGVTLVETREHRDLLSALTQPNRGLVVEGPSGIGKTTAIKHAVATLGRVCGHLLPYHKEIDAVERAEDVRGWLLIDDFHDLDDVRKRRLANVLRALPESNDRNDRKLIVMGLGEIERTLRNLNPLVHGRIDVIRIERQSDAKVDALLAKGERALNIVLEPRDWLRELSSGSLALAQQLAALAIKQADVHATCPHRVAVLVRRVRLRHELLQQLRKLFQDELVSLIRADHSMRRPRGLVLATLWLLRIRGKQNGGLPISDIVAAYPKLAEPARLEQDLSALLEQSRILSGSLRVREQRVSIVDPRLSFYLDSESFPTLAHAGGLGDIAIIDEREELTIRGAERLDGQAPIPNVALWEVVGPTLFWQHPHATQLWDVLADAYGRDCGPLVHLAESVGIPAAEVAFHGRPVRLGTYDLVNKAWERGALKALLDALREEDAIATYWRRLDDILSCSRDPRKAP